MSSVLEQLREMTVVVADTGDVEAVKRYKPIDCTTNPSLVLGALENPLSEELIAREIERARKAGLSLGMIAESLTVALGAELTELVPGRVSTEVEASLSFDSEASVRRARSIIADYEARGVGRDRILIKIAATWEGICAAEMLEGEGISCNLTLLFAMPQAIASANAKAYLISPFVGRITDWYKKKENVTDYDPEEDPGVKSVRQIYAYYKSNGVRTVVMGASFRNTGQIKALAGCDNLTIAPKLLDELAGEQSPLPRTLSPDHVEDIVARRIDEKTFRWEMNANAMATEKLAEGIRNFDLANRELVQMVAKRISDR
ncbi:MAG: transaldolase [Nitratireductor sp.]|nr:transaldolase [Nitratireductor sp.]